MKVGSTSQIQMTPPGPSRNKYLLLLILLLGGISYFVSTIFPTPFILQGASLYECPDQIFASLQYECKPPDLESPPIITIEARNLEFTNQFIALQAIPLIEKGVSQKNFTLDYEISSFQVYSDRNIQKVAMKKTRKQTEFKCSGEGDNIQCHPQTLGGVEKITGNHFIFVLKILNILEKGNQQITNLQLSFVTFNPLFQYYLSFLKWGLFAVAVISLLLYKRSFYGVSISQFEHEQNYVFYLSILIIFLDEPFLRYSSLNIHLGYSLLIVVVRSIHSALILLFWFSLLERLASDIDLVGPCASFMIKLIAFVHFAITMAAYVNIALDQRKDPFIDLQREKDLVFAIYRMYMFILLIGGLAWTLVKLFSIIPKLKDLQWRDKTSLSSLSCYLACYAIFMWTGNLQAINFKGHTLVFFYVISTLYTLILQVMYAPYDEEIEDARQRRRYDSGTFNELGASSRVEMDDVNLKNLDELRNKTGSKNYDTHET